LEFVVNWKETLRFLFQYRYFIEICMKPGDRNKMASHLREEKRSVDGMTQSKESIPL
jgi:hypothetical protein